MAEGGTYGSLPGWMQSITALAQARQPAQQQNSWTGWIQNLLALNQAAQQRQNGWLNQPYQAGTNPLAGVPEEYWQDALSAMNAALPWTQLAAQQAQQDRSYGLSAANLGLSQQQLAQAMAQQQWENQFNQGQADVGQNNWLAQFNANQNQANTTQNNWLAQFNAQQGQQGWENQFNQKQADVGQGNWLQSFGENQRQFNQNYGLSQQQLEQQKAAQAWAQAFQSAGLDYSRQNDAANRETALQQQAMATFNRRFAPSVAAM